MALLPNGQLPSLLLLPNGRAQPPALDALLATLYVALPGTKPGGVAAFSRAHLVLCVALRYKDKVTEYNARRHAVRVYRKQKHVDAAKRRIGKCAACGRPVEEGKEVMHEFNHLDEATKSKGGLFGKNGGVAGLVANCSNDAALKKVKGKLDDEISKCNLLCCNCHHRHTHKYEPSATQF